MIALYHPATRCDWSGGGNFHLWRSLADTLAENEAHGFFHADGAGAEAAIVESLRNPLVWALVLLPYADIRLVGAWSFGNLLAGSTLLKCRAYIESVALRGQHHGEQPLATSPMDATEIGKGSSLRQQDGVQFVFDH